MGVDERVHEAFDRGDFDGAATEALRGYGPEIRGYLLAMIRDEEDASDVFSQFAEDAWKGMRQFRWECSLRPWLYRVAYHAAARFARDQYRQRRRRFETTMASKIADEVRMSSVVRLDRRQQQIQKLRESLDPDERTLLILRIDRGLSWKDVSHVISEQGGAPIEEAALRKRFERVRDKLAQRAKEEGLLD